MGAPIINMAEQRALRSGSAPRRRSLGDAVRALAALGAGSRGGFSQLDFRFGKSLAGLPEPLWEAETTLLAWQMLRRYRGQLARLGIDFAALPEPKPPGETRKADPSGDRTITRTAHHFVIRFRSDSQVFAAVKQMGAAFVSHPSPHYTISADHVATVKAFADRHGFTFTEGVPASPPPPPPPPPAAPPPPCGTVTVSNSMFAVRFRKGAPQGALRAVQQMPGREYHHKVKTYLVPVVGNGQLMVQVAKQWGLQLPQGLEESVKRVVERTERLRAASAAADAELELKGLAEGYELKPYQRAGILYASETRRCFLADEMGLGKAMPLDAKVLTPSGWVAMGELTRGDMVIAADGYPTEVIGVFDQGERPIFRVTFSDGASVECDEEHLWAVNTPLRRWRGAPHRVLPLSAIMNSLTHRNGNRQHFIPIVAPVAHEERDLLIDPYLLGLLLGDGGLTENSIMFTTADLELVRAASELLPAGMAVSHKSGYDYRFIGRKGKRNPLGAALSDLGLRGRTSHTKFVPADYLRGSIGQRLAVLQGLIDTDGHVRPKDNHVEYGTVSERLAENVRELVESLGGTARIRSVVVGFRLTIAMPAGMVPCRLARKTAVYRPRSKYQPSRAIVAVEYVGIKPARCIRVAHPEHLYVTEHHIVTHNTLQAMGTVVHNDAFPVICVVPQAVRANWALEWEKFFPGHSLRVLSGNKRKVAAGWEPFVDLVLEQERGEQRVPDVTILNYDVIGTVDYDKDADEITGLHGHLEDLVRLGAKSLIVDESHYIKTPKAQRSLAVRALSESIFERHGKKEPFVLLLSGTPLENRPAELIHQLQVLGRLDDFGGAGRFKGRYCGGEKSEKYLTELNDRLRAVCYVRRIKADVYGELEPVVRSMVPMECDPKVMVEYRKAESDVAEFLAKRAEELAVESGLDDDEAVRTYWEKKLRIESVAHLVVVNVLKRLAAKAKLPAAKAWLKNFHASTDEKILVFGEHRDIVDELQQFLRCDKIQGGQTSEARQAVVERFQTGDARSLVLSLKAGGTGLTLTAASNCAFLEQGWTSTIHDQAEARFYGRANDLHGGNAYYLLAPDTVDMRIAHLIESKRQVVSAVSDGTEMTDEPQGAGSILGNLLVELAHEGLERREK